MKGGEREQDATIQLRIPKALKEKVIETSDRKCHNVSALVRRFLEDYVETNKK